MSFFNKKGTVLHFAPEKQIEKKIRSNKKMIYITADIEAGRADRVEDITHISFQTNILIILFVIMYSNILKMKKRPLWN